MNENVKANYLKTFLYTTIGFGAGIGLLFALIGYATTAIGLGLVAGLLFGGIITTFAAVLESRVDKVRKEFIGDVPVVLKGSANHLITGEAAGGRLFLTKDSLHFKSHGFNFNNHETVVPLSDVKSVEKFNMFGIVPNGMKIITASGHESFVVNNRKRWVREINSRISGQ